jgi:hypothetical protein
LAALGQSLRAAHLSIQEDTMSKVKTEFYGHGDDGVTIRRVQDVEGHIKSNLEDQAKGGNDLSFGRRVASIPNVIIEKWMKEEGLNIFDMHKDPAIRRAVFRKLNDPEWRYLRTDNSRL